MSKPAEDWLLDNEPQHWSMLHTSLTPTIISAGYRYNVIPSEAKATIDVRLHPDEDQSKFLDTLRAVINDPNVEVRWARDRYRPAGGSQLKTEAFAVLEAQVQKHYGAVVLPTMGTGATDMAQIRSKGVQCYGIGPAIDSEDGGKGFGAHSDQERILESELHRFVQFQHDVVMDLARAQIGGRRRLWMTEADRGDGREGEVEETGRRPHRSPWSPAVCELPISDFATVNPSTCTSSR